MTDPSGTLDGFDLDVIGTPPGFESVETDVRLDAGADPAALEELSGGVLRMSIIPDTIARPVPVSMRLATSAERHPPEVRR